MNNTIVNNHIEQFWFAEYEQIKLDIAELKASVEEFNQDRADFDKEKKSLAEEVVKQKESEFEQKKVEIETKKKETKERVKKLKKEIKESSGIDASLIGLDQTVSNNLDKWERELSSLSVSTGFLNTLKNYWNRVWDWAGRNKKNLLIWWAIYLWYRGLRSLFKRKKKNKSESNDEDGNKKPRYKRRWSWLGIGVAGFFWWKYLGDFKNIWNKLFNKEKAQKDKFGEEIAGSLGSERSYDKVKNEFKKWNVKYKRKTFEEKWLIFIEEDAKGKPVLDIEKTTNAIRDYVEKDTETLPVTHDITNFEMNKVKRESLSVSEKENYTKLDNQIDWFYKEIYEWTELDYSQKLGLDKWYFLFHFDQNFNNIGSLLNEKSFSLFVDSTANTMVRSIFSYMPKWLGSMFLGLAKWLNFVGFDEFAEDLSWLDDYIKKMQPTELSKLENLCRAFFQQATTIAFYALSVRQTYEEKVWSNPEKMKEFDQKKLKDLLQENVSDEDLLEAINDPKIDRSLEKKLEKLGSRKEKLLDKLANAENDVERKKIAKILLDEIGSLGYEVWHGAFSMAWWFMRETSKYVDYDLISNVYEDYFGDMKKEMKAILKKNPLTESDIQKIKQNIEDFYESMKQISTQTKLRQETDEDGKLFTIVDFPIVKWGKNVYKTFVTYMQDGKWVCAGLTLLAVDAALYAPRKILSIARAGKKWIFLRLSPTAFVMRKLGKFGVYVFGAWAEYAMRTPTRAMNQALNMSRVRRVMKFSSPEKLFEALNKWHIRIDDAAKLLADKAKGKTLIWIKSDRFVGEKFRKLGFWTDLLHNQRKLLEHNPWVRNNLWPYGPQNAKKYDLLIKNWNKKEVLIARRRWFSAEKLDKLFLKLESETTSKAASKLNRAGKKLNKLWEEVNDLSTRITKHRTEIERAAKGITTEFEKELLEEAAKKNLKKWTKAYDKLSKKIRESSSYWPKLEWILAKNNDVIIKAEEELMKQFNKASWKGKQKLVESNQIIKNIVEKNWWLKKRKLPAVWRYWRLISVGVHAVMIGRVWSSKDEHWNQKNWSTVWGEAADFGLWMIPVAWGVYDIGMAFRGKDLNGRQMWAGERWVRWLVGLGTWVLDVFTVGLWGTAIRAGLKWWTKVAVKVWTKGAAKVVAKESTTIAAKWLTKWSAKQLFKSTIRNTVIWTASGIALVPIVGWVREVFVSDKDEGTVDEWRENYYFDDDWIENEQDWFENWDAYDEGWDYYDFEYGSEEEFEERYDDYKMAV